MASKKRIEEQWLKFEARVIPKSASSIQRTEMRRAFYAGAWVMLALVESLGEENVTEDEGVAALDSIKRECLKFTALIGKKY